MRRGIRSQSGFTMTELLIATAIMLTITGAIFGLMNPAQGTGQTQPEVSDMQQRMRVSSETLFKEIVMAGAGPYQGPASGSLVNFFAPVLPRRTGQLNPDPTRGPGSFRNDAITLVYVPNSYSQTTINATMPPNSAELKVNDQLNCPQGEELCGFKVGMSVVVFDSSGNFDAFTITQVQSSAGHLQHRGQNLSYQYEPSANVTQVVSTTFYLNRATNQLMQYDGATSDLPLVDNVVDLRFDYYGDINPPKEPKPKGVNAGKANCLYDALGNYVGLPTLTPDEGSLAALTADMLTDGPFCGGGSNEYDADLLRIRKVRVALRVQVGLAALRGTDAALFVRPGTAAGGERYVSDYRTQFDVAPRNLNLAR